MAHFECKECSTFQCDICEELLHENSRFIFHERNALNEISDDLICEGDCEERNFIDVECKDCNRKLCFACDQTSHAQGARKKHVRQPFTGSTAKKELDTFLSDKENLDATDEYISCEPDLPGM